MSITQQLTEHLSFIYGDETGPQIAAELQHRLDDFKQRYPHLSAGQSRHNQVTEADAILITYGDQLQEPNKPTLQSLAGFLDRYLKGIVSSVHILPFYPYSSDDGFSVVDYRAVHPEMGDWPDVAKLRHNFRLMFDGVINHISAHSEWFQGFLQGDEKYANYFITEDPNTDLSQVTRPRALPLLTEVQTAKGHKHVWTTFSADQIDLNYGNPEILLEIVDLLLFYVTEGAEFIRLDAIAYMWKEVGTSCIHLPQTHRIIQLFRTVLDMVAPSVVLITETNVPHAENISYFGDSQNEAQMVYNFTLAPLILHTFHTANAEVLQQWAAGLEKLPDTATFFNFIASHDGIGVRPAEGVLNPAEVQRLVDKTLAHGGQVSYKANPDGSQSPYELNVTLFDALSDPNSDEPEELKIKRLIASQAIMLALIGVPGIYIHSMVGSANNLAGLAETGRARTINREKWQRADIEAALNDPQDRASRVFQQYVNLLQARAKQPAFHPNGGQQIIPTQPAIFTVLRTAPGGTPSVLCIHNISDQPQKLELPLSNWSIPSTLRDLLSGKPVTAEGDMLQLTLAPYEVVWLA